MGDTAAFSSRRELIGTKQFGTPQLRRPFFSVETTHNVDKLKLTGTRAHALNAAPPCLAGLQHHSLTASRAARSRRAEPLEVSISTVNTFPSASTSTCKMTVPCSCRRIASIG